jgi:hypothetical protein
MKSDANHLLFVLDIAGTLVFAVEGAAAAMRANLDLLGLMVPAFATALGGGIIRDVLIGAVPPASLRDWRYSAVAFTGAAFSFCIRSCRAFREHSFWFWTQQVWLCSRLPGRKRRSFLGCIPSCRFCWGRSRELAEARCATYCWRRSRACCGRMFTQRRRWRDQR